MPELRKSDTPAPTIIAESTRPPIIYPACYLDTPLTRHIEQLCDPAAPVTDESLVSLVLKSFVAFVHEEAMDAVIPLSDVTNLFELFSRHRSLNEPGDDIGLMNQLRRYSFALRMLADAPKTAHLMRSIIGKRIPSEPWDRNFVGLDIGTGAGVLMMGQYIQARRNGFRRIESWGVENDPLLGERTFAFCRDLRIGIVVPVDAKRPEAYSVVLGKTPVCVANETISAMSSSIGAEDFLTINKTLFSTMRGKLKNAHFVPEGLIVYAREQNVSVVLSKNNAFLGPKEYRHMHMYPQGLIIENQIVPLHSIGQEFLRFFPPESRWMLHRRW
jgi:hypothetical protein